ncbi:MAG: T9SS type A sorting domain-containing protein [Bacteroidales bacterium]|nr:T9SS type A sorting domain-containing protein [Bacteroidales bacterium]
MKRFSKTFAAIIFAVVFVSSAFAQTINESAFPIDEGKGDFYSLKSSTDVNKDKFTDVNGQNAVGKNWDVKCHDTKGPISTTDTYKSSEANKNLYIKGYTNHYSEKDYVVFSLYLKPDVPVEIVSEMIDTTILDEKGGWHSFIKIPVEQDGHEFTIYGDLISADFRYSASGVFNYEVYGEIECVNDSLQVLYLCDAWPKFTKVDGIQHFILENTYFGSATDLDLTAMTKLKSLRVNKCSTQTIKVASDSLVEVKCYDNKMVAEAYDNLMCQLPNVEDGKFIPLKNSSDPISEIFSKTNANNALSKGWSVQYNEGGDVPSTLGNFDCKSGLDYVESIEFSLYPNPAEEVLFIDGIQSEQVSVYDINGRLVKQVVSDGMIDIRDLNSGVYAVKIQNTVKKFVVK